MASDVVIIGAGPAGLFAARELARSGMSVVLVEMGKDVEERHCPIEELGRCVHCARCDIMAGMGGAGTFSDGTLNLDPAIGGDLVEFTKDAEKAWKLIREVDEVFLAHGAPDSLLEGAESDISDLKRRAASVGARFVAIRQRHIGSDRAPAVIASLRDEVSSLGVRILTRTKVEDLVVENGRCSGVVLEGGARLEARAVLACPGRVGAGWGQAVLLRHGVKAYNGPIDVGVRVEVPAIIMDPITRINRDPKFHLWTDRYDDFVRTFCTNDHGYVVEERYQDVIGVNGHALAARRSENTNFAFLVRVELTEPVEDTTRYGHSIARLATTIGGGRPIVQRIGDLLRGRRTTLSRLGRNAVVPTLKEVTPGDISMALPHRVVLDIIEGLEKLNRIIPGILSDSTLLYAPEIKFYALRTVVDEALETSLPGLFAAGDGMGLSRDIVNAAATGILAARGIVGRLS